jgi:hypothetical protein
METTVVNIAFPELDSAAAHRMAESLLSELRQDSELRPDLNLDRTRVGRTDSEAMDFGAVLIAVLGTRAVVILARAIKAWAERSADDVTVELDGVRIENVRSKDVADIVKALGKAGVVARA